MSILDAVGCGMPSFFQYFSDKKLINSDHVLSTKDGFYMIGRSISSILISKGIETFPGASVLIGFFKKRCHTSGFSDFRAANFPLYFTI